MSDDIDVLKPETVLKHKYAVIATRKNALQFAPASSEGVALPALPCT